MYVGLFEKEGGPPSFFSQFVDKLCYSFYKNWYLFPFSFSAKHKWTPANHPQKFWEIQIQIKWISMPSKKDSMTLNKNTDNYTAEKSSTITLKYFWKTPTTQYTPSQTLRKKSEFISTRLSHSAIWTKNSLKNFMIFNII